MKNTSKRLYRILTSLCMSGSSGRKLLLGMLRFANELGSWSIEIVNNKTELTPRLIDRDFDGFIGVAPDEFLTSLKVHGIPAVVLDYPSDSFTSDKTPITFITDDDEQIGKMGAEYILSLGNFAAIAFVPSKEKYKWSLYRQNGFINQLTRRKMTARLHSAPSGDLASWLQDLPKPTAIMAAYDFLAKDIIDTCLRAKIEVPNQVCILGVDDDELICNYTQPQLSSIRIDHADFGYFAAKALEALIRKDRKHLHQSHLRHPADRIIERESTRPIPPTTHLVNKLQDFIKAHAKEPITVADVVRHAHVSRRLADMRLKQCSGKTIHQLLQETRLKLVKNYLTKTQMPINKISRLCGFQNIQRLKYIFKTEYGISMREWRQNHSS